METLIKESSKKSIMKNQINWANSFEISEQIYDVKPELLGVLSRLRTHEKSRSSPDQSKIDAWEKLSDHYSEVLSDENLNKLFFATQDEGQAFVDKYYTELRPLLEEEEKYFQEEE